MRILSTTLAAAAAIITFALPTVSTAQNMPGPDAHQPMPDNRMQHGDMSPGDMHQGNTRGDMPTGDARTGDMHGDDMHHYDMHHDDMHGMRGYGMGTHHGWHRHCRMMWHHHHRVRFCR